jgi:hypothetical protein
MTVSVTIQSTSYLGLIGGFSRIVVNLVRLPVDCWINFSVNFSVLFSIDCILVGFTACLGV